MTVVSKAAEIRKRLAEIQARIDRAAKSAGRDPEAIRLVASTRTLMTEPTLAAGQAGLRDFCEDYLPEGVTKRPIVDRSFPGVTWHFKGTIPPKKIGIAVEFFDWLHTIDRLTLKRAFVEALEKKPRTINVLLEVNVVGSLKRSGAAPEELPALAEAFSAIPGVTLAGLSFNTEAAVPLEVGVRAFREVASIQRRMLEQGELPPNATVLAMGSSRDFEQAIEAGSTMVRLGSALFSEYRSESVADPSNHRR